MTRHFLVSLLATCAPDLRINGNFYVLGDTWFLSLDSLAAAVLARLEAS